MACEASRYMNLVNDQGRGGLRCLRCLGGWAGRALRVLDGRQ